MYRMSSGYLLPACLVLFTLYINFGEIWKLRKKVGVLFFTGMIGVVLGGPFLSVFSYAIGTYTGYLCGILMQWAAP